MVWTVPITFVDADPLTAAQLNVFLRDNMLETGPGKATTGARLLTTFGVNQIGERQWARTVLNSTITTTNKEYAVIQDEDDVLYGPTLTVEHGGKCLVFYDANVTSTTGGAAMFGPVFDGDTREAANPASTVNSNVSVTAKAAASARRSGARLGGIMLYTGEPGLLRVDMGYGSINTSSSATYSHRRLSIYPF